MGYTIRKNNKGFSLLEIVVSISIFSIVFIMMVNILSYINKLQKDTLLSYNIESGFQNVINKMNTNIEETSLNYFFYPVIVNPSSNLFLLTRDNLPLVYRLNNKKIEFSDNGGISFYALNDSNVEIDDLDFYVSKDSEDKVSLITITILGNYIDSFNSKKAFNYQTTIEQKLYIK